MERLRMGNSMKNLAVTVETKQTSAERKAAATLVRDAGLHTPLNPDPNVRCSGVIYNPTECQVRYPLGGRIVIRHILNNRMFGRVNILSWQV